MFERECALYDFLREYAHRLTGDLSDSDLGRQPAPGINPPGWILGHLVVAADYGLQLLGVAKVCPDAWHARFKPTSVPDGGPYPPLAELLAKYDEVHAALPAAALRATSEWAGNPHPFEPLREALPTQGMLMAHLLTTHEAIHLGQLSAWRRAAGLPASPRPL